MILEDTSKVGNDAGWHLHFFTASEDAPALSVGSGDYYASVAATLPSGLDGGTYELTIEGITNADYKKLHTPWSAKQTLYVDLYLYWRDAGVLGYLASVGGLSDTIDRLAGKPDVAARVARLQVTRLGRRVGARRYEAVIEARERVFEALRKTPEDTPAAATDARSAAVAIAKELLQAIDPLHPSYKDTQKPSVPADSSTPKAQPPAYRTGIDALVQLERNMIFQAGKGGRGMYLIRDGVLYIGVRDIPLDGKVKALSGENGLAHVETTGISNTDDSDDGPPLRPQYVLTLKGRPDIKPGDKISFLDPFRDAEGNSVDPSAALGATTTPSSFGDALSGLGKSMFGGASAQLGGILEAYVSGVHHRLSRTDGFVTEVTALAAAAGDEWDPVNNSRTTTEADPAATPHVDAAAAIQDLVRAHASEPLAIGEIRSTNVSGANEPPTQTSDIWLGLVDDDGLPFRARRLAIDRDAKARVTGVPYVTPFAWGKCGLVLPRYPGTRVLVGHTSGHVDDPVELGAVWESGHGPDCQAGDWWLILPAAVDSAKRQSAEDSETPQEPGQKATNDLIDADGNRVIEVGKLTLRVLPKKLQAPGTRPAAPSDSAEQVTIEHENGSRIVIKDNGDIVIHSEANLTLSAKKAMTLEADDMQLKVKNAVDVVDR